MNRKERRANKGSSGSAHSDDQIKIHSLFHEALNHQEAGRFAEADHIYRQILLINPKHAHTLYMMGLMAFDLKGYGIATNLINQALAIENNYLFHKTMGDVYSAQSESDKAIASFGQAVKLKPDFADAYNNLGTIFNTLGREEEALAAYKNALAINPDYAEALNNIGTILQQQKKYDEALHYYKRSVALNPLSAETHTNLGKLLNSIKDYRGAENSFRQALLYNPNYADAHAFLGSILAEKDFFEEAAFHYEQALQAFPDNASILNNLGSAYRHLKKFEKAQAYLERALKLEPRQSEIISNIGSVLKDTGQINQALDCFRKALSINPKQNNTYSNLLLAMVYASSVSAIEMAETAKAFGKNIADPLLRQRLLQRDANPLRQIKIGYISSDFRDHSINYFFEPLLSHLDHKQFEIFLYANNMAEDEVTVRLKAKSDHWQNIYYMSDDEAADLIEKDQIDILVDLTGHTAKNRLLIFARKPAPIQVTWLGHPATTGMKAMDFRITDHYADPEGLTESLNTETLWRLPGMFCCYQAASEPVAVDTLPLEKNGYITFGCFNNFSRVSDETLSAWAKILKQIPNARLLLEISGLDDPAFKISIQNRLHDFGLPHEQILLEPRHKSNQFILYNRLDIALDPFPSNGGTTSMDTLWMGVPFITKAGDQFLSRLGVTMLSNGGLSELIAETSDDYVQIAVELAKDANHLKALRSGLREKIARSPLMDAQAFAFNMGTAYREMWVLWCSAQKDS